VVPSTNSLLGRTGPYEFPNVKKGPTGGVEVGTYGLGKKEVQGGRKTIRQTRPERWKVHRNGEGGIPRGTKNWRWMLVDEKRVRYKGEAFREWGASTTSEGT